MELTRGDHRPSLREWKRANQRRAVTMMLPRHPGDPEKLKGDLDKPAGTPVPSPDLKRFE